MKKSKDEILEMIGYIVGTFLYYLILYLIPILITIGSGCVFIHFIRSGPYFNNNGLYDTEYVMHSVFITGVTIVVVLCFVLYIYKTKVIDVLLGFKKSKKPIKQEINEVTSIPVEKEIQDKNEQEPQQINQDIPAFSSDSIRELYRIYTESDGLIDHDSFNEYLGVTALDEFDKCNHSVSVLDIGNNMLDEMIDKGDDRSTKYFDEAKAVWSKSQLIL